MVCGLVMLFACTSMLHPCRACSRPVLEREISREFRNLLEFQRVRKVQASKSSSQCTKSANHVTRCSSDEAVPRRPSSQHGFRFLMICGIPAVCMAGGELHGALWRCATAWSNLRGMTKGRAQLHDAAGQVRRRAHEHPEPDLGQGPRRCRLGHRCLRRCCLR